MSARNSPRTDDAELVAFGIREHDVVLVATLSDVDVVRAELDHPVDDLAPMLDGLADQIEVDRVLRDLLLRNRKEDEDESSAVGRITPISSVGVVMDLPIEQRPPRTWQDGDDRLRRSRG